MALTTQDKIGLGQLGLSGLGGLLGGLDDSAEQQVAQNRDDQLFLLLMQALQNQGGVEQDIAAENLQRSLAFSNANPLGAEYNLRKGNNLFREGLNALGDRQLAKGLPNIAAGFTNRPGVADALSDASVDEAIRQRRVATTGLDPRAAQEINPNDYASQLFGELQQSQNDRRANAQQGYDAIQQRQLASQPVSEEKDKKGFWSKLGSAVLPIAGVAANFIPGVGPVAGTLLSAAGGAAGGALAGGKKGALVGGLGGTGAGIATNVAGLGQTPKERPMNNMLSGPVGTMNSPQTNLLLGGIPNTNMSGFPQSVGQNRPAIQSALSAPPPSGSTSAPSQNVPTIPFKFGQGLDTTSPNPTGTLNWFGGQYALPNMRSHASASSPTSVPHDVQSSSSVPQSVFEGSSFDPRGIAAQGYMERGATHPQTLLGSALGAIPAGVVAGATGLLPTLARSAGAPSVAAGSTAVASQVAPKIQKLLSGNPMFQKLLTSGQQQLSRGMPRGYLPAQTQTSVDSQNTIMKLMEALKAYNSGSPEDIKASQDLIQMMQPFLKDIPGRVLPITRATGAGIAQGRR